MPTKPENLVPLVRLIRGEKVLLDTDLADLYGVAAKVLNQAVKRNAERFPEDFMFQLTREEADAIQASRSQIVTLKRGQNVKFLGYAFTEQGVAMLSSVLRSPRAARPGRSGGSGSCPEVPTSTPRWQYFARRAATGADLSPKVAVFQG